MKYNLKSLSRMRQCHNFNNPKKNNLWTRNFLEGFSIWKWSYILLSKCSRKNFISEIFSRLQNIKLNDEYHEKRMHLRILTDHFEFMKYNILLFHRNKRKHFHLFKTVVLFNSYLKFTSWILNMSKLDL